MLKRYIRTEDNQIFDIYDIIDTICEQSSYLPRKYFKLEKTSDSRGSVKLSWNGGHGAVILNCTGNIVKRSNDIIDLITTEDLISYFYNDAWKYKAKKSKEYLEPFIIQNEEEPKELKWLIKHDNLVILAIYTKQHKDYKLAAYRMDKKDEWHIRKGE